MIWSQAERVGEQVRIVLSEQRGPEVDLVLGLRAACDLYAAMVEPIDDQRLVAATVDGEPVEIFVSGDDLGVHVDGDVSPMRFRLGETASEFAAALRRTIG